MHGKLSKAIAGKDELKIRAWGESDMNYIAGK